MNEPKNEADDGLVDWLENHIASSASGTSSPSASTDGDVAQRQRRLAKCVDALERVWPSRSDVEGTPPLLRGWHIPGYEVLGTLGRGGMGMVYRARQLSLGRDVALKILPPAVAADPERLRRFQAEAQIAAQLSKAHVVTVIDVFNTEAGPVLVMPYIDGPDLGRIIEQRRAMRTATPPNDPHALAKLPDRAYMDAMWPVLDQLIDAVAAVHAEGILHRDIKPANVLLDKDSNVRLTDFGLARLGDSRQFTMTGQGIGTAGFMSSEQWAGDLHIDQRADVFGLAATIYQALTLELPFGRSLLNINSPPPTAPCKLQRLLSPDMDTVLLKALEPDRRHRYSSAAEFRDDWQRVREGLIPTARRVGPVKRLGRSIRRHPRETAAIMLVVILLTTIGVLLWRKPGDDALAPTAAAPVLHRTVHVTTDPPEARVVLIPLDAHNERQLDRMLRPATGNVTPLAFSDVPPGHYLVVAEVPGFGFHEVYRIVPAAGQGHEGIFPHQRWYERDDGSVDLPPFRIPSRRIEDEMVRFAGGTFTMGPEADNGLTFPVKVAEFLLDPYETTIREFRKSGYKLPTPIAESLATSPPEYEDFPITGISFDEAMAIAELLGKRLPLETEYEFAATMGGTRVFPWGDDLRSGRWGPIGPVRAETVDRTPTEPPVFGLYSNAAEWADTQFLPYDSRMSQGGGGNPAHIVLGLRTTRVIRGAPPFAISRTTMSESDTVSASQWKSPRCRQRKSRHLNSPMVGFRCARSVAAPGLTIP